MIKKLMVFALVASMAAPVSAASNGIDLLRDTATTKAVEAEIEAYLKQEAKTNKKIALAMQTEAAKRQLIAYFVTGVVVAGGVALVVYYFLKNKADNDKKTEAGQVPTEAANTVAVVTNGAVQAVSKGAIAADKLPVQSDDLASANADALQALRKEILADVASALRNGAAVLDKKAANVDGTLATALADINELKSQIRMMKDLSVAVTPAPAPVVIAAPAPAAAAIPATAAPAPVVADVLAVAGTGPGGY